LTHRTAAAYSRRVRVRTCLALLLTLAAAACAPGGIARPVSVPPPPAKTGVPDTGPITLTIWDQESGPPSKVWDQLNAEFEAKYPNVTIKRVNRDFGELKTLLKLSISGPHAPDVVEANQGWPDMGGLVRAGLLVPLDNYAKAYGWDEKVSENVRRVSTWTPDGKEFGTGNLFGYTTMGEIVGVYYNKQLLAQAGIAQVPTTFAEFEQDLATAKQAGITSIQFGNNDGFPGIHDFMTIQDQMAPTDYLTDLILGTQRDALSFDTPENVQAATALRDWADKGYFTSGFGGGGYDSSVANFANGQGLFMITGNWIVGDLGPDNTNFGFFPLPAATDGAPPVATGGAGFPLAITVGSDHPDAAAAYIDWMNSDHAAELLLKAGQIPLAAGVGESIVEPGTVLADVVHTASEVSKANGIVPYEDWATPTFYDTLTAGVQELMADRISPQQFVDQAQKDYADFQSGRQGG
jgi:raffinose/stachyose/melibiose transport system substrate-binding protein